jgi:hypothetical protein
VAPALVPTEVPVVYIQTDMVTVSPGVTASEAQSLSTADSAPDPVGAIRQEGLPWYSVVVS